MSVNVAPRFLTNQARQLFSLNYRSTGVAKSREGVLLLPGFAEEMNCMRRLTHSIAYSLGEAGYEVLSIDLSNTGDSSGSFSSARFSHWLEDVVFAFQWLQRSVSSVHLLGFRAGSLFLPELYTKFRGQLSKVCLVQPMGDGEQWLNEFLRIRVAKSLFEGKKENVEILKNRLTGGSCIEVAGYELGPDLYKEILAQDLVGSGLEIDEQGLLIFVQRKLDAARARELTNSARDWSAKGDVFKGTVVRGDAFWASDLSIYPDELKQLVLSYFKGS